MSNRQVEAKLKKSERKNWFRRLLERIAKANQENSGQVCSV